MLKKILTIFKRDIKVNLRESITMYIMLAPLLLAVAINLISPSINDTTVNLALVEGENAAQAQYFGDFAHVELFADEAAIEERVQRRDNVVGVLKSPSGYYMLTQGNEPESVVGYSKLLNALYESDVSLADSESQIYDFGRTIPPLKKMLVNILLLMIPMLAGMIIALNIVEEKADNTVSAVNVTPTSRRTFILGKSLMGMAVALVMSLASLAITGFIGSNIAQILLVVIASAIIAMLIGFVQGVNSTDIMEAASSVKLMFLPLAGSIVGYELLTGNWQIFFYWSPFYWAYRANDMILSKTGSWGEFLIYIAIIFAICGGFYALLAPRIRKGLEK